MATLDSLLYEQTSTIESMTRLLTNLKKVGKNNFTPAILQGRLSNLNTIRAECKELDRQIYATASAEQRKTLSYYTKAKYLGAEDIHYQVCDYISTALATCTPTPSANSTTIGNCSLSDGMHSSYRVLPPINVPKFSGAYTDWVSFRDLFQSLVIDDSKLHNVQRLFYLKQSVSDEAASLLKTITLSDANFALAWNQLKDRYENSRHLIDSYLAKLFDVSAVTTENVKDLKRLRDNTYEAVTSLGNLEVPVDQWDHVITFMTVRKLDSTSRREWEMRIGEKTAYPTYKEIHAFLEYRIRALESILPQPNKKPNKPKDVGNSTKSHQSTASKLCECDENHPLHKCEQFRAKPVEQRQKIVRKHNLCSNCLSAGHQPKNCHSKDVCYHCKQKHHTLLHQNSKKSKSELSFTPGSNATPSIPSGTSTPQKPAPPVKIDSQATTSQNIVSHLHANDTKLAPITVMLATAWVNVSSSKGRTTRVRALLDQGSQSSFVTESIAQTLRAPRIKINVLVTGIGGTDAGTGRALVKLTLTSCNGTNDEQIHCTAIVFQKLTSYVPPRSQCLTTWRHLEGLELADSEPSSGHAIQMILGADIYANILREGLKRGPIGSPVAQNTAFGWILSGPTTSDNSGNVTTLTAHLATDNSNLVTELRRFWELEEVPTCSPLSEEEIACESHFAATHTRLKEGRYSVRLPFKGRTPIAIGSSRFTAENWFAKLTRKFTRNPEMIEPYYDFMTEYWLLKHIIPTTFDAPDSTSAVYLPHHPVFKDSSTTRLRVVFNASNKTSNGTSLNDHLMIGPKLQSDLLSTILRWRQHQYALTADITKMYRQILVAPEDQRYQQILWRSTPESPITPYKLVTVTYGTASAPFLAMRVLKQLADDEEARFPNAASIIRHNFYVDDVLFGANDETTACSLRAELVNLLEQGGFTLRNWMSSHASLLADIPEDDLEKTKVRDFDSTEAIKILGIGWVPETDSFCFNATTPKRTQNTKRSVLSITAQLFDPLGWLSPVVIAAKILMQELWIAALGWDENLPRELSDKWDNYCERLPELQRISIPRWNHLASNETTCELHGFADASTRAYAAVVYLRTINTEGEIKVSLLAAKTNVAPIKTISVPRLELCAAVLLTKLIAYVTDAMKLKTVTTYAWIDSTVALAWIKQHPSEWPTFVANRVAMIQHMLHEVPWKHVPTKQNPADCASRGLTASELLDHPLWWQGPSWLQESQAKWPRDPPSLAKDTLVEAATSTTSHTATR